MTRNILIDVSIWIWFVCVQRVCFHGKRKHVLFCI